MCIAQCTYTRSFFSLESSSCPLCAYTTMEDRVWSDWPEFCVHEECNCRMLSTIINKWQTPRWYSIVDTYSALMQDVDKLPQQPVDFASELKAFVECFLPQVMQHSCLMVPTPLGLVSEQFKEHLTSGNANSSAHSTLVSKIKSVC